MQHTVKLRTALLIIFAGLGTTLSGAYAQPHAQEQQFGVYLPLVMGGSTSQAPSPTPAPWRTGFFALTDRLSYSAATAVDAKGGVHLALFISDERHDDQPLKEPALYSYCPGPVTACADPVQWSDPVMFGERVNEVQVALTHDGRPRLLVRRNGSRFNEYDYYACDSNCTQASQWSGLYVAEDAGGDLNAFSLGNHYFALDAQDRPRFAYGNGWGNGQPNGIYYAWCDDADCTQRGSWQRTRALVGPDNVTTSGEAASLAFEGDRPRMVFVTIDEFTKMLHQRYGQTLVTWRGDWADWWADGVGSSIYETSLNRATEELLPVLDLLSTQVEGTDPALIDEHTITAAVTLCYDLRCKN
jgi:hypothetical protein